jgi:hypothetical protein
MSGEVENAQAEMNSKALEGFLVGNQDLERLDALLDAHHLLVYEGTGSGSMPSARRRSRSSWQSLQG